MLVAKASSDKNIKLAPLRQTDIRNLLYWRNNPELRQYFREYREITMEMQNEWFNSLHDNPSAFMFGIQEIVRHRNVLIGACGLTSVDWISRSAEISLYIGQELVYIDERAEIALEILMDYAFGALNLRRLTIETFAFDNKKEDLCTRMGFYKEGTLVESHFHNGTYHDSNLWVFLRG